MGQFTRSGEGDREREEEMRQFTRSGEGDREREEEMRQFTRSGRETGRGRRKWAIYLILRI